MSKAVFIGLLASSLCAPPVLAVLSTPLPQDGPRLVLHPPWVDGVRLVQLAGGRPIGPNRAPIGVLAFASDNVDFDHRLHAAGAWTVLGGKSVAALCGLDAEDSGRGTGL
ncbi:hypothetical protein [Antarctobacter jejuensis]|uniref:hypothetical protein n=1 Tax=Antarctobacter jejuensis TaxID=1439938 RepID=UPI003FD1C296